MIKVAAVGYRKFPNGRDGDIIVFLPLVYQNSDKITYCHIDIVEERTTDDIPSLVETMLAKEPDVLHYANFRDPPSPKFRQTDDSTEGPDRAYINCVKSLSDLPILLSTAALRAEDIANGLEVHFLDVPFGSQQYIDKLSEVLKDNSSNI
tara:strand:+ start:3119 stop:3568 length:450 start_codon:yes stop_codon:yes gene_type:complete